MSKIRAFFLTLVIVVLASQIGGSTTARHTSVANNPLYVPAVSMVRSSNSVSIDSGNDANKKDYYPYWNPSTV